jgi:hypothetical protein
MDMEMERRVSVKPEIQCWRTGKGSVGGYIVDGHAKVQRVKWNYGIHSVYGFVL